MKSMKVKRLLVLAIIFVIVLGMGINVHASASRVFDNAELFTDEQVTEIERELLNLREDYSADFVVLTVDNAQGESAEEVARKFYENGGYGVGDDYNGMIYLIDMDNRELRIKTWGEMILVFDDARIETLIDIQYSYASEDDYYNAIAKSLSKGREFLESGIKDDQYTYDVDTGETVYYKSKLQRITLGMIILNLAISVAVGLTAVFIVNKNYKKKFQPVGYNYRGESKVDMKERTNTLVNKTVTTRRIQKTNRSSGGGRSMGSGSRSSVRRSSSGRSSGGGGRKF